MLNSSSKNLQGSAAASLVFVSIVTNFDGYNGADRVNEIQTEMLSMLKEVDKISFFRCSSS